MNHYHIYEAVGRGKYSTVYKGRKKKTIEYFAIKSVDKSHRKRFFKKYETSAHLWLVLEYCVGGDLLTLLQQDGKLPEDSIHDLACGLVIALQYLHSKGIIYCDLKPSNILLDENGHTKLCDFGLARKLSDIAITPSPQIPEAKRGSPCYMAPELFKEDGVHSYASDFWALGCVLYECYTGKPPFVEKEFTQLVKSILLDTPSLPGDATQPFVNLVNSLLVKNPAERIQWPELRNHAFWRTKFESLTLPHQPAFCSMIEQSLKPHLTEWNGDGPLRNKTPSKAGRKDVREPNKQDENSGTESKGNGTPIKGGSHKSQLRPSRGMRDGKKRDALDNMAGINLLRLSKIAKSNLQRENEKQNYRRPLPNGCTDDVEVKIANNDMELDFNETVEDDGHEENEGPDSSPSLAEDYLSAPSKQEVELEGKSGISGMENSNILETSSLHTSNGEGRELSSELVEPSPAAELANASPQLRTPLSKDASGQVHDFGGSSSSDFSVVIWHPSDLSVKPVMPSRKLDKGSDPMPNLPFHAYSPTDFTKVSREKLDVLCNKIRSALNGNDNVNKQNVVKYLEMLSSNIDAANILTNGPIMRDLVKMLRQSNPLALRVQLPSVIGLLIRHSTFVEDDLATSGILNALTEGLRDRQERVRRFSMAALGELLFYISTLNNPTRGDSHPQESPSKDSRASSCWQVPNSLISLVSSVLRKGEDDLTQLYALRTIENISSHGGHWATRLVSQDLISNLCYIFRAPGKQDSLRLTAGSCLVRLLRFTPSNIQQTIDKVPLKDIVSSLSKGNPREQQICLNLLNMAMVGSSLTNLGHHLHLLMEDKNLSSNILSLIEQGTEVLRGKTLLVLALLCKIRKRCLSHFFCNTRLLTAVDRLAKEKDAYLKNCLDAFVQLVVSTLPGLLETVIVDIQNLNGSRRPAQAGPGTRNSQRTSVHFFPVVLHLMESSLFKHSLVTPQILQLVATLLKLTELPFKGRDDFQVTLLRVLVSITEEPTVINNESSIFISQVLPSLVILYKGNKGGDSRYLCLKIFFDVMAQFLTEPPKDNKTQEELKRLSNTLFLPLYPSLIEDEDPIPVHAQKLLVMLIEANHIMVSDLLHLKAVSNCFGALLGDFSTINISNIRLCVALSSASELETKILSKLKVVRKIGNLLEFVHAKEMNDFIEPTLGLCKAFLLRSVSSRTSEYLNQPALLYDGRPFDGIADPEHCIKDIADFGVNAGVMLELSKLPEAAISNTASECLILMLKAAPREATVNFLMNLCKVSSILLERNCISNLVLERILYALGFSCQQYLLHSMILSIQKSELTKIEEAITDLKHCNAKRVIEAASRVSLDLQRMIPR